MNAHAPPKRKPGLAGSGLKTNLTYARYHHARRLQESLRVRQNRCLSIGQLMPDVLLATLAQMKLGSRSAK